MTSKNTTTNFSGHSSHGLQLGSNSGHVYFNIHGQLENTQQERCLDKLSNVAQALDAGNEDHRQRTSLVLNKLEESNRGVKRSRDKLEEIHSSDEESKCFETLRTSNYLARKDLNPERLPSTCRWFLDHPKYQDWTAQTPASRLLWVSANPGCGKSVLAKALVDQYDRRSVCYYFFKDDTIITRSAAHAICALLHQICDLRPSLIRYVLPMYRRNGKKMVDLFEDLWSTLVNIINDKDFGNVICILDAVDECSDKDYEKLLQRLAAIATSSTSIKILITSRPHTSIETALFHKTRLNKSEIRLSGEARVEQSMIEKEVGYFITSKVQEFQKSRRSKGINDDAHEKLQSHLDGVKNRTYLWVSAVFTELERDPYAPKYFLMKTIKALPDDVGKAYESILESSPKRKKPILIRILHVMLAAFRPLSLMEMKMVLSIQDTSSGLEISDLYPEDSFGEWLRDLCGFFINVVDNEIYFAHQTAREFLVGEDGYQATMGWRGSFQQADSHTLLARICLDYLLLLYDGLLDTTFEIYATSYWPSHCQSFGVDQSLEDKVKGFLFHKSAPSPFERWIIAAERFRLELDSQHFWIMNVLSEPPTPLFLACYFCWHSVINVLQSFSDINWNKKNIKGDTGLTVAARGGHLDIVKLFLKAGADVKIRNDAFGRTALHGAASRGYLEIVTLLWLAGADVNIQDYYRKKTALHSASSSGHLEIVKLLLSAGADVNIQDSSQSTALHSAAARGHLKIVKLLLNSGADVDVQSSSQGTTLYSAASSEHLEIVKLLMTEGADIKIQDSFGRTALHSAAATGQLEIVKLLLSAGADVNLQNRMNETSLYAAASNGHFEIVKLLLSAGADVNIRDYLEQTALHSAVSRGYIHVVKLLLSAGADINIQNPSQPTVLHLAASSGHLKIVKLLLSAGADVNIQNPSQQTVLHSASSNGYVDIVKLLLTEGANVNTQDSSQTTTLHSAITRGHLEIVKLLLLARADVNIPDFDGKTPLHSAASSGRLKIVELLLSAGTDVNIKTLYGETALQLAIRAGNLDIVRLLLNAGADVNTENDNGTAMHWAVLEGHLEIVKLTLSAGANVNIKNYHQGTALHLAASSGNLEIVKLLLSAGADVNIPGFARETALHSASSNGHFEIVKLLLTGGVDVNIQDSFQETALHVAASSGHLKTVKLLLSAGGDVKIQDGYFKKTALHSAVSSGYVDIVKLLLTEGADVNTECDEGTALHIAKDRNVVHIVETLLAAGAVDS